MNNEFLHEKVRNAKSMGKACGEADHPTSSARWPMHSPENALLGRGFAGAVRKWESDLPGPVSASSDQRQKRTIESPSFASVQPHIGRTLFFQMSKVLPEGSIQRDRPTTWLLCRRTIVQPRPPNEAGIRQM